MSQTPSIGRIVIFNTRLSSLKFLQSDREVAQHPAVVTRAHKDGTLNLQVLADGSNPFFKQKIPDDPAIGSWWSWPERVD